MSITLRQMFRKSRALFGPPRPLILYHQPTARCDCRCHFCDLWTRQPPEEEMLSTPRVYKLLDQAYTAGMVEYVVFGGEPLLVQDLPAWFQYASKLGWNTTICTSGYRLQERAKEIGPNTSTLLLSLEALGEKQDRIRGTPGLFRRLVEGLHDFKKYSHSTIYLWSNISSENRDQIASLAQFAKSENVGVFFFPTARLENYNEKLLLTPQELAEAFQEVKDLKRRGFPVKNSSHALKLMATGQRFQCNLPRLSIHVSAQGQVSACDPRIALPSIEYGSMEEVDLKQLHRSNTYRHNWETLRSCNNCLFPCVTATCDNLWIQAMYRLPFVP